MEKKTAADARAFCNSIGSKLFEPRDLPTNAFVASEAKARGLSQFWIGVGDVQTESTFRYDSNDESITWNNWNKGQPNNYGVGEDCTAVGVTQISYSYGREWSHELNLDSSVIGQWWDQQCHNLKGFVCESSGNEIAKKHFKKHTFKCTLLAYFYVKG